MINEFMARNDSCCADEYGEYEDWIEVYNPNPEAIDIGGLYITNDLGDPTMWQIPLAHPDSTTVQADGFLILWADRDSEQGALHLPFTLSRSGGQIGLAKVANDSYVFIDSLSFGEQSADISHGRFPDGTASWSFFSRTSPGSPNHGGVITAVMEAYTGDGENSLTRSYALHQNYPNPFNSSTSIQYSLPEPALVTLEIYNLNGQKLRTMNPGYQSAGIYLSHG